MRKLCDINLKTYAAIHGSIKSKVENIMFIDIYFNRFEMYLL